VAPGGKTVQIAHTGEPAFRPANLPPSLTLLRTATRRAASMDYSICPRCGQKALHVATRCPRCGLPFETQFVGAASASKPKRIPIGLVIGGGVAVVLFAAGIWLKAPVTPPARLPVTAVQPVVAPQLPPAPAEQAAGTGTDTVSTLPSHPVDTPREAPPPVVDTVRPPAPAPAAPAAEPVKSAAPTSAAMPIDTAGGKRFYASTWINVRSDRSNTAPVLRILKPGEVVRVDVLERGWYRVAGDTTSPGYVDRRFLSDSSPTSPP
jgi:ribosomal protein L37E